MERVMQIGDGVFRVDVDGRAETIYVAGSVGDRWAFWNGRVFRFTDERPRTSTRRRAAGHIEVTAPMPARIVAIRVKPGDEVKTGETLVVVEAMKMELPVQAPSDGRVGAIHCGPGQLVDGGAVLIELE